MHFESELNIGDTAFVRNHAIKVSRLVTIAQIRIEYTDSPGRGDPDEIFDNYKPQKSYKEEYMCIETGVGCGKFYTYNSSIFKTKSECDNFWEEKEKKND